MNALDIHRELARYADVEMRWLTFHCGIPGAADAMGRFDVHGTRRDVSWWQDQTQAVVLRPAGTAYYYAPCATGGFAWAAAQVTGPSVPNVFVECFSAATSTPNGIPDPGADPDHPDDR